MALRAALLIVTLIGATSVAASAAAACLAIRRLVVLDGD